MLCQLCENFICIGLVWKCQTSSEIYYPIMGFNISCINTQIPYQSGTDTELLFSILFDKCDSFLCRGSHNDCTGVMLLLLIIYRPNSNRHIDQKWYPSRGYILWWGFHGTQCLDCQIFNKYSFSPILSVLHNNKNKNLCDHVMWAGILPRGWGEDLLIPMTVCYSDLSALLGLAVIICEQDF